MRFYRILVAVPFCKLFYGCHLEYPNPIMIMLTTSMPLPRVMVLSVVARQVIKDPMPIIIVPSIADSL